MSPKMRHELLSLLGDLQLFKVDAPLPLVAKLISMIADIEHVEGHAILKQQLSVLLIAVFPLEDHKERPEGFTEFVGALIKRIAEQLETEESASPP